MSLTRREFLVTVSVAGSVVAFLPAITLNNAPVLSFHLDQPFIDLTGMLTPYVPPVGARGGEPLAALSDEALARYYGLI